MAGKGAVVDQPAAATACCPTAPAAPLSEDRAAELARGFAALADPARLRLLGIMSTAEAGEVCGCELVEPLGKSQPTVSHHLKVLADAGLVVGSRRGRWVWYRLVPERLAELRHALGPGQDPLG
ncbi:MAG: metalloregulator ArsR/SmtB family transcription factor [Actinobacteria bacterium]|nr:metalloregulator ArsR/SmtB family transcription factor [Actinomycetota bacterium]